MADKGIQELSLLATHLMQDFSKLDSFFSLSAFIRESI
jgi:hypothetical protein